MNCCNFSKLHQVWFLTGSQTVPKYGKPEQETDIQNFLYLIRFPEIKTDILISSNEVSAGEMVAMTTDEFTEFVSSLKISDWGLFEQ